MDLCPLIDLLCQSRWWDVIFFRRGLPVTHIPGPWSKLHTCDCALKSPRPALVLWLCPVHSDVGEPSPRLSGKVCTPCGLQLGGLPSLWQGLGNSHMHTGMIPALPLFLLSCEVQFVGMEAAWFNPCSTLCPISAPPHP